LWLAGGDVNSLAKGERDNEKQSHANSLAGMRASGG
jgi:hypothetical protein